MSCAYKYLAILQLSYYIHNLTDNAIPILLKTVLEL